MSSDLDDYGSTIRIGRTDLELKEYEVKFREFIYNNCRGIINIFDENNIIQTINFNELNIHSFIRFSLDVQISRLRKIH